MQFLFYSFLPLICIVFLWFLLPFFIRKIQTFYLKSRCAKKRAIVLTFDDGPSDNFTLKLAKYLHQHDVRATFFVLGCRAEQNPEIMAQISQNNHVIGSHSYKHLNAWRSNPIANMKDIIKGVKIVSSAGVENKLFRPPYGKTTLLSLLYIFFQDIKLSWWTIDPKDSLENPVAQQNILEQIRKDNGGVVLLHDWNDYPMPNHEDYVMSLVEKIIVMAKNEGYKFALVHEV